MLKKIIILVGLLSSSLVYSQEYFPKDPEERKLYLENIWKEDQADAFLLMSRIEGKSECYSSILKLNGHQSMKLNDFKFTESLLSKRIVVCFNDKVALLSSSDSKYIKLSNNSFVSFSSNKKIENIETLQLDYDNEIMKYTKNIIINKSSDMEKIQGVSSFVGLLIKITK